MLFFWLEEMIVVFSSHTSALFGLHSANLWILVSEGLNQIKGLKVNVTSVETNIVSILINDV